MTSAAEPRPYDDNNNTDNDDIEDDLVYLQTNFARLLSQAKEGDVHAQFLVADYYSNAADQGSAKAQYRIGSCYYWGNGVHRTSDEARAKQIWAQVMPHLMLEAEHNNDAEAQYVLGKAFYSGHGVEENETESFRWYKRAAEQGHAEAQFQVGLCYRYGWRGQGVNLPLACQWFTRSAQQGRFDSSQYELALCYRHGQGVKRDGMQAIYWYKRAASTGHNAATMDLKEFWQDIDKQRDQLLHRLDQFLNGGDYGDDDDEDDEEEDDEEEDDDDNDKDDDDENNNTSNKKDIARTVTAGLWTHLLATLASVRPAGLSPLFKAIGEMVSHQLQQVSSEKRTDNNKNNSTRSAVMDNNKKRKAIG